MSRAQKIKEHIASELAAFLVNEKICPEYIEINVRYMQSNAKLFIQKNELDTMFEESEVAQ